MVVSRPMIAQAPDNSWSELLTSSHGRSRCFFPKVSNLAQNRRRRPVIIMLCRLPGWAAS
jgi:hypothetical protein